MVVVVVVAVVGGGGVVVAVRVHCTRKPISYRISTMLPQDQKHRTLKHLTVVSDFLGFGKVVQQIVESSGIRPKANGGGLNEWWTRWRRHATGPGFLQQIGENFGICPKASSRGADLISARLGRSSVSTADR